MGNTPKWDRGAHLEISTNEKLDYLYSRDDAQQEQIDANIVKVTPATYPEGTETYNIATIKVGNTTKTLKGKEGGGGGSGVFEINFTVVFDDQQQTDIITCDKTYAEILAAKQAGDYIVANANFYNDIRTKDCFSIINPPTVGFMFIGVSTNNAQLLVTAIVYNDYTNAWMLQASTYYTLTPAT